MELYELTSPVEQLLADKAQAMRQPLGGTMELLPLCNMDCKMCYIRQTRVEMETQGQMLSCDEWLRIAREAKEKGVLYLLLTGGEPLLYAEFKRLYCSLTDMGFVITINTNGTLIDEEWADFFASRPCRRMSITLYGASDDTYARLCGNPKGYTQVMHAANLLKERDIPFRFTCSVTPYNRPDVPMIASIAEKMGVRLDANTYMFPPCRKGEGEHSSFERLSPEEAAKAVLELFYAEKTDTTREETAAINTLNALKSHRPEELVADGLTCRAGRSGFWMNWKGEMLPCGMFLEPKISLMEHSFSECWDYIVKETAQILRCEDCAQCKKRNLCRMCAAACYTETGSFSKRPDYLCQMTDKEIDLLLDMISSEQRTEYLELLG